MSPWKYLDQSRQVAFRSLDDGGMESKSAAVISDPILPPDAPSKATQKAAALATATAAGFTFDQVRILSTLFLAVAGTQPQKAKAAPILAALFQLVTDGNAATAAIDAGQIPAAIASPIIPTDDP